MNSLFTGKLHESSFPGLLRLVRRPHRVHQHHRQLHGGLGEVVEEPGRHQILPVHGQRQCSLPQVLFSGKWEEYLNRFKVDRLNHF